MKLLNHRISLAILLFSFLSVQLTSIVCLIGNLVHEYAISDEDNHHLHHDHNHHQHEDDMESEGDENCCVENTSVFLTAIEAIPHNGKIQLDPPIQIDLFICFSNEEAYYEPKLVDYQIRPPPLLLLSPSSKRVFIQSFQI